MQRGNGVRRGPARSRHETRPRAAAPVLLFLLLLQTTLCPDALPASGRPVIPVTYSGEIGCSHCGTFGGTLPWLEERYGVDFDITIRDILSPASYEDCRGRLEAMGRPFRTFPVLFIGNNAYQGQTAADRGLEAELEHLLEYGEFRPRVPPALDGSAVTLDTCGLRPLDGLRESLPLLPVLAAGLADGINPCAFAAMLFLLSLLALLGRSRREMLLVGLIYGTMVFITYFALGWGILEALRQAMNVELLRSLLRAAVSAGTGLLALLSLRDALLIRSGRSGAAVLQLSPTAKRRIHALMRWGAGRGADPGKQREAARGDICAEAPGGSGKGKRGRSMGTRWAGTAVGTAAVAFLVSLLELACTGQLYLPTIAYLLQTGSPRAGEIAALLLYNAAFILPLLILFAAVYSGLSLTAVNRWFRRNAAGAKFLSGGVLALLAVGIWLV
jgi:hypothetical protein